MALEEQEELILKVEVVEDGGYPSAGIGGGGAGAGGSTCCAGGSGYTAGSASGASQKSVNGLRGKPYARSYTDGINPDLNSTTYVAGGYFYGTLDGNGNLILGGYDAKYNGTLGHQSGSGGTGGQGGIIKVSDNAKVYAFNGNYFTDNISGHEYGNGLNQCPIYLQNGISIAKYDMTDDTHLFLKTAQTTVNKSGYINNIYIENEIFSSKRTLNINTSLGITGNPLTNVDMSLLGVGSGAGYIELSNGTYTIDSSLN